MGDSKGAIESISRLTPEQQETFTRLLGDFDPTALTEMFQGSVADPARQQFQQQTIPGIQERFNAGGGARSGAVGRAGVQAGANLESGLSGQLAQLLSGAQQSHLNRQGQLATSPTLEQYQQNSSDPLAALLGPLATGAGLAIGGPVGAAGGSALSGLFSSKQK